MASFKKTQSISHLQRFNAQVYGVPDNRMYSIWDLLGQTQRFGMRSLKGIRKGDKEKITHNLLISLSWVLAIANRLHIDIEDEVWKRFPQRCSYCGRTPCACKAHKVTKRQKIKRNDALRPASVEEFQTMFKKIYPPATRTLAEAGMHLAEEIGEVTEAVHNFLGQYKDRQFDDIRVEIADFVSCVFGVANSADISVAHAYAALFRNNCHVCHQAPCTCNFAYVAKLKT